MGYDSPYQLSGLETAGRSEPAPLLKDDAVAAETAPAAGATIAGLGSANRKVLLMVGILIGATIYLNYKGRQP